MGTIIICEDDAVQSAYLRSLISKFEPWCNWTVEQIASAGELLAAEHLLQEADILLMDICLGAENGIQIVGTLQQQYPELRIIYVTGEVGYCSDVYDTRHCGFLLKPVDPEKLCDALRRTESPSRQAQRFLTVKLVGRVCRYSLDQVLYMEKQLRKIMLVTSGETVCFYGTFSDIQPQLDRRFIRCHGSYLANMDHVAELREGEFLMQEGQKVPISRRSLSQVRESFLNYLLEKNAMM